MGRTVPLYFPGFCFLFVFVFGVFFVFLLFFVFLFLVFAFFHTYNCFHFLVLCSNHSPCHCQLYSVCP